MPVTLSFHADPGELDDVDTLLVIGRKERLLAADVRARLPKSLAEGAWEAMVAAEARDQPRSAASFTGGRPRRVVAGVLPEACSRHNPPSRAWALPTLVRAAGKTGPTGILLALDTKAHAFASACGLAPALPSWTATSRPGERSVRVAFLAPDGDIADVEALGVATEATQRAASWVDMPADRLNTRALVKAARDIAREVGASCHVIEGEALQEQGLGGLHAVGRAAAEPPALVVLDHEPDHATRSKATRSKATRSVAWVGKGIVYDTGGLSMKTRTSMVGMKKDMGGAAAVLAAFEAAVRLGCRQRLTAILCLAENAVGPNALRPDDVITLLSGKTVEINNTDAEGRLVLGDGVAWAARHRAPDDLIDLATLTGAQAVATGKRHAALYTNDEGFEAEAIAAGRASGNPVHPLPYLPELLKSEFASTVADMRNSVKNRANAQSSCAGQFIGNHLEGYEGRWLHVDMAGPAADRDRGTGYGVALLLTLAGVGG